MIEATTMAPNQEYMTIQAAARYLNRSDKSVQGYMSQGRLTRVKIGNGVFISRAQVEALAIELAAKDRKKGGDDDGD